MGINRNHVHDFLSRWFVEVATCGGNEISDLLNLLLVVLFHGTGVARSNLVESLLDFQAPIDLVNHQTKLGGPVEAPLVSRLRVVVRLHCIEAVKLELAPHLVNDQVHVLFNLAVEAHLALEGDRLLAHAGYDSLCLWTPARSGVFCVQGKFLDGLETFVHVDHNLDRVVSV